MVWTVGQWLGGGVFVFFAVELEEESWPSAMKAVAGMTNDSP